MCCFDQYLLTSIWTLIYYIFKVLDAISRCSSWCMLAKENFNIYYQNGINDYFLYFKNLRPKCSGCCHFQNRTYLYLNNNKTMTYNDHKRSDWKWKKLKTNHIFAFSPLSCLFDSLKGRVTFNTLKLKIVEFKLMVEAFSNIKSNIFWK